MGEPQPPRPKTTQPARALFNGRRWPEGYSFPACSKCNEVARPYENVFALLTRIGPGSDTSAARQAELITLLRASSNNFPHLLHLMTTREKRAFYKAEGIERPEGVAFSEIPMVTVDAQLTQDASNIIFSKLFSALHYKHTKSIVPPDGQIFMRWITNAYTHRGEGFDSFLSLLHGRPVLSRANAPLKDQFDYAYVVDPGAQFSAFYCTFRKSIIGYGLVFCEPALAGDDFDPEDLRGPLKWD